MSVRSVLINGVVDASPLLAKREQNPGSRDADQPRVMAEAPGALMSPA